METFQHVNATLKEQVNARPKEQVSVRPKEQVNVRPKEQVNARPKEQVWLGLVGLLLRTSVYSSTRMQAQMGGHGELEMS